MARGKRNTPKPPAAPPAATDEQQAAVDKQETIGSVIERIKAANTDEEITTILEDDNTPKDKGIADAAADRLSQLEAVKEKHTAVLKEIAETGPEDKEALTAFAENKENDQDLRDAADSRLQEFARDEQKAEEAKVKLLKDIESSEDEQALSKLTTDKDYDADVQNAAADRLSQLDTIKTTREHEAAQRRGAPPLEDRDDLEQDPDPVAAAVEDEWTYDPEGPGENPSTLAFRYREDPQTGLTKLQRWSGNTIDWEDAGAYKNTRKARKQIELLRGGPDEG